MEARAEQSGGWELRTAPLRLQPQGHQTVEAGAYAATGISESGEHVSHVGYGSMG
jgi:hypothetical protein